VVTSEDRRTLRSVAAEPEGVGNRVREEREKAGLSLSELASLTGVSKAYLVRLETRPSNPSLQILKRIADGLELTVADLLDRPSVHYELEDDHPIPASLQAFRDEERLSFTEVRTLASIKFRRGEEPQTSERWRYIYDSLRLSRSLDRTDDAA
jgi:transcriptional regulator with XRE-family HTH domain